jgi:hypothetical protein
LCLSSETSCSAEVANESISDSDLAVMKTKLAHIVYSDRNEAEIVELTKSTVVRRQSWIREESPSAAEILKQYPRFTDTPSLVSADFLPSFLN